MNAQRRHSTMETAQSIAASGFHANWRAVQTKLHQLGYHDADELFADRAFREGIDALCSASRKD